MISDSDFNRVRWRCRRGSLELDMILGGFLASHFAGLSEAEQGDFERLLVHPDHLLSEWLWQKTPPPDDLRDIVGKIR
ncbi:MAG: FAD assembly factor SdhE [Acidiferrobacterales bacterium]